VRRAALLAEGRRRELAEVLESRARFTRGVSHDLKNPLGAIDGHAALLEEGIKGPLTPDQSSSVGRIRALVRAQLRLIEDIMELARAEAGQLRVEPRRVELGPLLHDVVEEHRAAAEAAGHQLRCSAPGGAVAYADPERLHQVLGNLLSNAVKYTPPGGAIAVGVRQGAPLVGVEVVDSGPGIPPDKLDAVFEEFTRLETYGKPGTGVGLSIARRIARLLGGDITVESRVGHGATFVLWLPARAEGER
jgi:signal transduction histidine kinase